ncbi:solute carrier family 30 member 9 isoform X5 [Rhodnius prolixus]|uniref:solute carrier family 30 member 9 isoform X5 n=1 Tax=Rhodnius prolixus TaxID=13249 RepID=UPI003D18AE98
MLPRSNSFAKFLYYKMTVKVDLCINKGSSRYFRNSRSFCQSMGRTSSSTQSQDSKTAQKSVESKAVEIIKEAVSKDEPIEKVSSKGVDESIRSKLEKLVTNAPTSVSQEKADEDKKENIEESLINKLEKLAAVNTQSLSNLKETKPERREQHRKSKLSKAEQIGQGKTDKDKEFKEKTKKAVKKRIRVDLSATSMERNFITPARAMTDFLLKPDDLKSLKATKRRSPYENEPPITVYWRKDVEAKAIDVWGSKENLLKELLKKELERKFYQQNIFTNKRRLRDYRRERNTQNEICLSREAGLFGSSGKVVLTAVAINGSNFLFKLFAWLYTGSHSMFSESIHSLADTINQLILAFGIHKSVQRADSDHPYGYSNMKYVASLISGVGIFCVGAGLSVYHGITGLIHPASSEPFFWAFCILGGSLVSEGATLLVAINSIRKGARIKGMSFREYVFRGQDPSVNVVLLEDMAAVLGVVVAASCMALTAAYDSHVPDAVGSIIIGGLLGVVASFIIYTNVAALVGRSIPQELLERINAELESDVMIRAIHDVKGIDMGNCLVRYKAELDFDGRELARSYLDHQDLNSLLQEVQQFKSIDELEPFILKHSENIVDMMGGEIDRIEMKLRSKFPEIRHCDLEIL